MKTLNYIILLAFSVLLYTCKEDVRAPLEINNTKPENITNITVENLPGGAKISYALPDDDNILYVVATYKLATETRIVKSSVFKNYVVMEGFADTNEHSITLQTVNRSEVYSDPITATIKPLISPLSQVFSTLSASEAFGGIKLHFLNENRGEYVLYTLIKDEDGGWVEYDRLYTQAQERDYYVRGLESVPIEFGVYFTDKWKNHSDTLFTTILPLYEVLCDKSLWKNAKLEDDTYISRYSSWALENLWNEEGTSPYWITDPALPGLTKPNWFTIDLGKQYRLGRINVQQLSHHDSYMFAGGAPKLFEIWASNVASINWDNWVLLGTFESVKPSGRPQGQLTDEDRAVNLAGEEFDFDVLPDGYRYVRFKTLDTYSGRPDVSIREITLWGQPIE